MPVATQKSYYDILGVSKDASQDEVRKAYLDLARKHHPDKTGGDKASEEKLKQVNEAYDTLKNPEKRKEYDAARENPFAGAGFGGGGGARPGSREYRSDFSGFDFGGGAAGGGAAGFEDIFGDIFGGGMGGGFTQRRSGPRPGNDLEVSLPVTLREVATGTKKTIRVTREVRCDTCGGTGAQPGTTPQTCPECGGSGQSRRQAAGFSVAQTCRRCGGRGTVITTPCTSCGGQGKRKEPQTVTVNIPAGAENGTRLRLAGQGEAGERGAPEGDLYVSIAVKPDDVFEREGENIRCEVPVSFTDAALGATIRVPTLSGEAELKIPAGTQSGRTFRMRGQGLPALHGGGKGDELVRVAIEVPKRMNGEQRRLLEEFRKQESPDMYPGAKTFRQQTRTKR